MHCSEGQKNFAKKNTISYEFCVQIADFFPGGTQKMSRAQIREDAEKREAIARGKDPAAKKEVPVVPLEENVNRIEAETATARTVDEALEVLR